MLLGLYLVLQVVRAGEDDKWGVDASPAELVQKYVPLARAFPPTHVGDNDRIGIVLQQRERLVRGQRYSYLDTVVLEVPTVGVLFWAVVDPEDGLCGGLPLCVALASL